MNEIITEYPYKNNNGILLIQINRPKNLNALNNNVIKSIVNTLEEFDGHTSHRITIITGDKKAFAAGADLLALMNTSTIDQYLNERESLWKRFKAIRKPILAAVDGFSLGGGNELAMGCDLIMATTDAKFGQPEVNLGLIPGAGGTQRLTQAIGKAKAMRLCLTGEIIDAKKAFDWGLVSYLVPSRVLLQEAYQVCKKICDKPKVATMLIKESINASFEMNLTQGLAFERKNFNITFSSKDQEEGINAFIEKRAPNFKGN